jgi:hypothetical protein
MTDDQLRALVRETVARHLGAGAGAAAIPGAGPGATAHAPVEAATAVIVLRHASHYRYGLTSGDDEEGPCFIEPSVRCNHCGYCQSHGH